MRTHWLLAAAAAIALTAAPAFADFPEMVGALNDLQSARAHLRSGKEGFGGHRQNALSAVERAIAEVKAGLQVGNRREKQDEKKVKKLEHKQKKIEKRIDKLQN
jgi:cob(I)alamin adenosyltransferase